MKRSFLFLGKEKYKSHFMKEKKNKTLCQNTSTHHLGNILTLLAKENIFCYYFFSIQVCTAMFSYIWETLCLDIIIFTKNTIYIMIS